MREYFNNAYEGFSNLMQSFIYFCEIIAEGAKVLFVYVTLPIWIIPYRLIMRRAKDGK